MLLEKTEGDLLIQGNSPWCTIKLKSCLHAQLIFLPLDKTFYSKELAIDVKVTNQLRHASRDKKDGRIYGTRGQSLGKRTLELEWNSFFATGIWESSGLLHNIKVVHKYKNLTEQKCKRLRGWIRQEG